MMRFTFKSDGDYVYSEYYSGSWHGIEYGKWKVNGNKLIIDDEEAATIVTLNSTTLKIKHYEKEPGYEYSAEITFKRVD